MRNNAFPVIVAVLITIMAGVVIGLIVADAKKSINNKVICASVGGVTGQVRGERGMPYPRRGVIAIPHKMAAVI